jgi:hypothetical protein
MFEYTTEIFDEVIPNSTNNNDIKKTNFDVYKISYDRCLNFSTSAYEPTFDGTERFTESLMIEDMGTPYFFRLSNEKIIRNMTSLLEQHITGDSIILDLTLIPLCDITTIRFHNAMMKRCSMHLQTMVHVSMFENTQLVTGLDLYYIIMAFIKKCRIRNMNIKQMKFAFYCISIWYERLRHCTTCRMNGHVSTKCKICAFYTLVLMWRHNA